MRGLAALIAAMFAGIGCSHQVNGYPEQPEMTTGIDRSVEVVDLRVTWHDTVDSVDQACGPVKGLMILYGCARWVIQDGRSYCVIQAMPPSSFNDVPLLAVLGHELMHCFNARHG